MIYLVVGDGKLATHLLHYFKLLNLTVYHWHYQNHPRSTVSLALYLQQIEKDNFCCPKKINIFVVIKDSVINRFITDNLDTKLYTSIFHCSGALTTNLATRLHPLMTFAHTLYELETYKNIPFVTCCTQSIKDNLLELPNMVYTIDTEQAGLYHAICVLIGNFTQILWSRASNQIEQKLQLPKEIINLYLTQVVNNYVSSPGNCLTGPLVRNDLETIDKNLQSLKSANSNLSDIYQNLVTLYHDQN